MMRFLSTRTKASTVNKLMNKQFLRAGALVLGLVSLRAMAAPVLLEDSQSVIVKASPAKVWEVVGKYSDLTWVPLVKASQADRDNTVGSVRTLDLGGANMTETLKRYDAAKRSYTYAIDNTEANQKLVPLSDVEATIRVEPAEGGASKVSWTAHFHRLDHADQPAKGKDDEAAKQTMHGVIEAGLKGLQQRVGG